MAELWGGADVGGADNSRDKEAAGSRSIGAGESGEGGTKRGLTYAQVASSSSEDNLSKLKKKVHLRSNSKMKTGVKRPRSPRDGACGRCFRTSHATAECRHQVVCMRCSCVGHVAARCPVEARRSPRRRRLHVRSKLVGSVAGPQKAEREMSGITKLHQSSGDSRSEGTTSGMESRMVVNQASLSLSLSPESDALREDLAKVAVLSIVGGYDNEGSVLEVVPSLINVNPAGPILPLNENSCLIPFANRDEVREVVNLGTFDAITKDGPCVLRLANWTAEIGAEGRAVDDGQWVTVWNLPLHDWCWSVIEKVLRPIGELITLSKMTVPHKRFITALVRRRVGSMLPMELDFSFGMRKFQILIVGERGEHPKFSHAAGKYFFSEPSNVDVDRPTVETRSTLDILKTVKGKLPICNNIGCERAPEEGTLKLGISGSSDLRRNNEGAPVSGVGITILQRRKEGSEDAATLSECQRPLVERSSHGLDKEEPRKPKPPVEQSSRGDGVSRGPLRQSIWNGPMDIWGGCGLQSNKGMGRATCLGCMARGRDVSKCGRSVQIRLLGWRKPAFFLGLTRLSGPRLAWEILIRWNHLGSCMDWPRHMNWLQMCIRNPRWV